MQLNYVLDELPRSMLAVAHRGYSAKYPENTPLAQKKALDFGCRIIEADVRRSVDGVFFCHHDETLERLAGNPAPAESLKWDELCGILPHKPAIVSEALDLVRERNALLLLDLKITKSKDLSDLGRLILTRNALGNVIVGIRHISQIEIIAEAAPGIRFLGLLEQAGKQADDFFAHGGHVLRLWEDELERDGLPQALSRGMPFWVTAGGAKSGDVGEATADRLLRCKQRGAWAVLVNDLAVFDAALRMEGK